MGIKATAADVAALRRKGVIPGGKGKDAAPALVTPGAVRPGVWLVAYHPVSEANARQWQARSRRAGMAWRAVRAAVKLSDLSVWEALLRSGRPVRARFVRLGGRRLDPMDNLPASMKGVADALAFLCGADDGSPLWLPSCGQEAGVEHGVRIELGVG